MGPSGPNLLSLFRNTPSHRIISLNPAWRRLHARSLLTTGTTSNARDSRLFTSSSPGSRGLSADVGCSKFRDIQPWNHCTGLLTSFPAGYAFKRNKSSKKKRKDSRTKYGTSEEPEDEEDSDDDDDDVDVELQSGADFRDMKVKLPSLRMDAIIKAGLNISRNKVETTFYASKIRINGEKLQKKSQQIHEGDEVDIERDDLSNNPSLMYVSRVVVLRVGHFDERKSQFSAVLRRYPKLLIERPDAWDKGED